MLNLRKIAITGGVASGKSSVCQFFKELGAFVVSSDAIVHELLQDSTSDLRRQVVRLLGVEPPSDEKIFRKIIAEKVFKDPNLLTSLEKILHPAVLQRIEELYAKMIKQRTYSYFVVEIPLLFEIQGEDFYDTIVTVLADEKKAKARFVQAGFLESEYSQRMQRQMDPVKKGAKSHYTIYNNETLEDLKKQVINLHQTLQKN